MEHIARLEGDMAELSDAVKEEIHAAFAEAFPNAGFTDGEPSSTDQLKRLLQKLGAT